MHNWHKSMCFIKHLSHFRYITLRDVVRSETCHHHRQTSKKPAITPIKQVRRATMPFWNTPTCAPAARKTHHLKLTFQPIATHIPKSLTPTMSSTYPMEIQPTISIQPPNQFMFTCTLPQKLEVLENCPLRDVTVIWKNQAMIFMKLGKAVVYRRQSKKRMIELKFRPYHQPCHQDHHPERDLMVKELWVHEVILRKVCSTNS